MQYVIDYDPILGPTKIIGPFEDKDAADRWGERHIHLGAWHSMPLTPASAVATPSSEWSRTPASATHA